MAVFGAPLPHSEPAAAAARAALRAREAVEALAARDNAGSPLRFGFGINTGAVAAGCLGGQGSSEYGVIGAPVNIAARLEEAARPGQILVGAEAAALLDKRFVMTGERSVNLKGIASSVRAAELISFTSL
jgi:class 3 adenylate cyclase